MVCIFSVRGVSIGEMLQNYIFKLTHLKSLSFYNLDTCDDASFQCYDQKCIPKSLVCDGYVDCSGRFSEDENQNCQNDVHSTCAEWWALGKRENGEYLISLGLTGTSICIFV